jgi:pyruvate/2-oxoglutarate dehydrogenase complex dihydrolipoamide dehydrogenase (E3) component
MSQHDPEAYDAVVIGAGQSGGPLSAALAKSGRRTALIERQFVGGSCINYGCTPTKTMVASARVAYLARRASDYGVQIGSVTVDMAAVRERKRKIVESFRSGSQKHVEAAGVDLIFGEARFTAPHEIEVRLKDGGVSSDHCFLDLHQHGRAPIRSSSSWPRCPGHARLDIDSGACRATRTPGHHWGRLYRH